MPKWRNWQTQLTQNPPGLNTRVGSTPTFGTSKHKIPHPLVPKAYRLLVLYFCRKITEPEKDKAGLLPLTS
jgi:hypothetical protein